jgi:hypothetical protein
MTELLLKVALITIKQKQKQYKSQHNSNNKERFSSIGFISPETLK